MTTTATIDWASIPQRGGDVGTDGVTTTVTGTPSTAVDGINFAGTVILDNNGRVELQTSTISSAGEVVVASGTNLVLNQSTLPTGKIKMDGGTLYNQNAYDTNGENLIIDFGDTTSKTNTVTLNAYSLSHITFTNVAPGDNITFTNSYGNISLVDSGEGIITVKDSSGKTLTTFHTAKDKDGNYYTASSFSSSADGDNSVLTCFLAGSMILTTQGVVAVEELQMGDEVLAFDWQRGEDVVRPLVWVGKAHAVVRPHLPDDEAGYPVRILKNALADGVPFKDMLITAEHCLFFEDKFIPARMLVNGSSIFYDKSILSYDYYHVETAEHSVLTADGTLTESYLDTGNRAAFRQTGKVVTLSAQPRSWENNAAAPLCVARSVVEGLFRQIRARTSKVDNARKADGKTTLVHNPELHLVTESGAVIMPMRHEGARYSFMLPPDITAVRLVSRAARPSDVIGPFVDDRRQLGVAVSDIRLVAGRKLTLIKTHLDAQKPEGWYDAGQEDLAWTNGNALLPLGKMQKGTMGLLSIDVLAAGPYIAETQPQSDVTLSA
ncbi:Hint domain-containing protein [Acetobacter indonesiensis]